MAGMATGGVFAAADFYGNVKNGDDVVTAGMKTAASSMLWAAAPWTMAIGSVAMAAPAAVEGYTNWKKGKEEWWNQQFYRGTVGGQYQDTQRALTMRQAAVQQIQGSKLNARSALGGEARILNENYHRS